MVIVDTNLVIDHLCHSRFQISWFERLIQDFGEENLEISSITVQELFTGQSTTNTKALAILEATISRLKICDHDTVIAQKAGELRRDSKSGLTFADAAIAATALKRRASLATLNRKDFQDIPGLELVDLTNFSTVS